MALRLAAGMNEPESEAAAEPEYDPARDRSLADDLRTLAGDAKRAAASEFDYQTARAGYAVAGIKMIALYGALAVAVGFFALMALVVGLLLALTPLITAWGATAVVVIGLAVTGFLLVRAASGRWRRMMAALGKEGAES